MVLVQLGPAWCGSPLPPCKTRLQRLRCISGTTPIWEEASAHADVFTGAHCSFSDLSDGFFVSALETKP